MMFGEAHLMVDINESLQRDAYMENERNQPYSLSYMLGHLSVRSFPPCIYRVPDSLRRASLQSFTPRLVSIGPFHHGSPHLKPMEDLKLRYYRNFLNRDSRSDFKGEHIPNYLGEREEVIRNHYQENIDFNSEAFRRMILLDAVFIIELLLKKEAGDPMFENRWWFSDLLNDMLLIENQIPLFIVKDIYYNFYLLDDPTDFSYLVRNFFKNVKDVPYNLPLDPSDYDAKWGQRHFVEFLLAAHAAIEEPIAATPVNPIPLNPENLVTLDPENPIPLNPETLPPSNLVPSLPWKFDASTSSKLFECGVKFQRGPGIAHVDIKFQARVGILTIPQLKVNEWTETMFRNFVAFEQCHHVVPRYASDYLIFMNGLIDTPGDVKILTDAAIIQDDLQNPEKVTDMFNSLHNEVITDGRDYLFIEQSRILNDYRRDLSHRLKAWWYKSKLSLKRDYFNSPWSSISLFAASILVGLTVIQTVCSIYQAKGITM